MGTIEEVKKIQAEMDHRQQVENEAARLISECRLEEAVALLDSIA